MRSYQSHLVLAAALAAAGCSDFGVNRVQYHEEFTQVFDPVVVDVLFVVDNSGTMTEEQELLHTSFTGLTSLLSDLDADFQVGVITTDVEDPDQSGRLQGDVPIMTPDTPDLEAVFAASANVGTRGARTEQGLEAVRLATTTAVQDGSNTGFFRTGATLDVVIVSDEDDNSPDTVQSYVEALQAFKGDDPVHVSGVIGDLPDGCVSPAAEAEAGMRYAEAAQLTAGHVGSICLPDWTPLFEQIGFDLAGAGDTFVLADLPDSDTLEVRVDGVLMVELSPDRIQDGWTYDPAQNAIIFTGFAVPRSGQKVVVSYFK